MRKVELRMNELKKYEIIKKLVFDIPDKDSQLGVVAFLTMFDQRVNKSLDNIEKLLSLRASLLQQLFM